VTEQSEKQLYSNGYKLLHQTNKKSYFLSLNLLFCQYCNQIKLLPTNIYNTIQPYKAQLPCWYPIPKIHKNPISTRSICKAYNAFTTYASQVINKILKELYFSLLVKYPNLTSLINTICPDTDMAIHRVNLAFKHCLYKHLSTSPHLTSKDYTLTSWFPKPSLSSFLKTPS
jgi:hypothetical protein